MLLVLCLFGLALGTVSPVDVPAVRLQHGNCPPFWFSFKGRCYKYVATRMSWADAELHCLSQRANLVSIYSLDEDNFVKALIQNFDTAYAWTWIGLSDLHKEGRWMWSDGCPVKFAFWSSRQPDNAGGKEHCGHKNLGNEPKWNDYICSTALPFVCASRIDCH